MKKTNKVLIVSPYLDHLGGGERYMLSCAAVMEKLGSQVFFAWDNLPEITHLSQMLGITLHNPQLDPAVKLLYFSRNPFAMYRATRPYDVVVYLSDGSLPLLGARTNLVHMQVPFHDVGGQSLKNQFKKQFIGAVIVNSRFTKRIVDQEYSLNSRVIYPPVETSVNPGRKTKTILSVGRFEPSLNTKKQDILIQAFRELSPQLPGWQLVLAGASASADWVAGLQKQARGLPVTFAVDVPHTDLARFYAEAAIYWHAAGYGIDANRNPELVEHFGITTVEAIAYGCLPLVVPHGGQPEIVPLRELHWKTVADLVEKTLTYRSASARQELLSQLSVADYTQANFASRLKDLLL